MIPLKCNIMLLLLGFPPVVSHPSTQNQTPYNTYEIWHDAIPPQPHCPDGRALSFFSRFPVLLSGTARMTPSWPLQIVCVMWLACLPQLNVGGDDVCHFQVAPLKAGAWFVSLSFPLPQRWPCSRWRPLHCVTCWVRSGSPRCHSVGMQRELHGVLSL